jgi:hypothetical protein
MIIRGKNGVVLKVDSQASLFLDDESDRRKDSVKLVLTVALGGDAEEVTVAEALTRAQADVMMDAFYAALLNDEYTIDMMKMGDAP